MGGDEETKKYRGKRLRKDEPQELQVPNRISRNIFPRDATLRPEDRRYGGRRSLDDLERNPTDDEL